MKIKIILFIISLTIGFSCYGSVQVLMKTSLGDVVLELDDEKAPASVKNFLSYVEDKFYDDTIFHRVIKDFMNQGGGYDGNYKQKTTKKPIKNEADNGLLNKKGTIAMARTSDPHSATAQFFINMKDNHFLDYKEKTIPGWGYAVFGKVISGMKVMEKLNNAPTDAGGIFRSDVPKKQVKIIKMELKND
jgi:peptidyl-prolyl cis-trans isomerase B (cyclophilin B)